MSRIAYSKIRLPFWDGFKSMSKNQSKEAFIGFWMDRFEDRRRYPDHNIRSLVHSISTTVAVKYGVVDHYFLPRGLSRFLIGSVTRICDDYYKPLPNRNFCIHFPEEERSDSIVVDMEVAEKWREKGGAYFIATDASSMIYGGDIIDWDASPHDPSLWENGGWDPVAENREAEVERQRYMARIIYGLSLYIDAFPDAVVPALPDTIHNTNHYKGRRMAVATTPIADEENRNSVSPHWRRGHFRVLSNAKFVHKQGMTVFVRGTFVKGKAYDVLDDAPPMAVAGA